MRRWLLIFAVLFAQAAFCDLIVNEASRKIRVVGHVIRTTTTYTVQNKGTSVAKEFVIGNSPRASGTVALVEATVDDKKARVSSVTDAGAAAWAVEMSLAKEATTTIKVKVVTMDAQEPLPEEIGQSDRQLVRFTDNHFLWSPYVVRTQKTEVRLPSSTIESHSHEKPTSARGDTITYGPYADVQPHSRSRMLVHFMNPSPFPTAEFVLKEIELSHWGNNVAVTEEIKVLHTGAKLKGGFSRVDNRGSTGVAIEKFRAPLPRGASDIYFRDQIGNVSTSRIVGEYPNAEVELMPRFPLYGGWRTSFYYGYNLPLHGFLGVSDSDPSLYVLNMTFGIPFSDVATRDHNVRVILPEGATDVEVRVPFSVDRMERSLHFTYLDTAGRPTVTLSKRNVVSDHASRVFQVTYRFPSTSLLHEPFLLFLSFFGFFILCMIYVRLDIDIVKKA